MYVVRTKSTRGRVQREELHFAHERRALPSDRQFVNAPRQVDESEARRLASEALLADVWVCWCDPQLSKPKESA